LQKRFEQVDCDGRISNIDKINDKIKKILESCSGLKEPVTYIPKREKSDFSTKNAEQNYEMTPSKGKKYGGTNEKFPLKLNLNLIEGLESHQKTKTSDIQNFREENSVKAQRSKSCLYTEQEEYRPKRDTEDRISKIQDKINSFNNKIAHHN
jgi:hypothetical protein